MTQTVLKSDNRAVPKRFYRFLPVPALVRGKDDHICSDFLKTEDTTEEYDDFDNFKIITTYRLVQLLMCRKSIFVLFFFSLTAQSSCVKFLFSLCMGIWK